MESYFKRKKRGSPTMDKPLNTTKQQIDKLKKDYKIAQISNSPKNYESIGRNLVPKLLEIIDKLLEKK